MKFFFIVFVLFISFNNCQTKHESLVSEIEDLISKEKYEKALVLLQDRLSAIRSNAEILSKNKPNQPRLFALSEDRTKIVWTENKTLYFKDLVNDNRNSIELKLRPDSIQISANGNYVAIQYPLKQYGGCALFGYSTMDSSLEHESIVHIPCKTGMAISNSGDLLLYFFENQLFIEKTGKSSKPEKFLSSDLFPSPYPKLKIHYHISPIGNEYLVWSGVGGAYNLFFLNIESKRASLLSKDIVLPKFYYHNGNSGYVVGGKIGDLYFKEVLYHQGKSPSINRGIPIVTREAYSWKLTGKDEFITTNQNDPNQPMKWKVSGKKEHFPFFIERLWGVAGDKIVYESRKGELVLDDLTFSEEDWKVYEYFKKVRKMNDG
ncbi:Hypothetical protein LBF_3171 [Leptospira biflexa serovar Patoc strain 'Patoc 1 (Ames)']|uniref:Uncharacterized protein n=1 Tax=Leptospira biflexa serovar Patoc (strain Patoc 1 / ATCC 23582 / Paris) TaxID=456481 RepID=B0SQV2_LEPBP|nr:hypothetical protein [Leptospira biflexa]ABZ95640.1 Hypothetical protein LBF_3171 [Leptospira biflexa serovar Patoc strain 'Patoc 1 (Ames)']ABZ99349.1 Conserved hypothetical protein [Leptospira biflexa serovar Patoc strain 'Patoc 1 (Paris)']TGM37318.1 hypothetical protein EHQ80_06860 [Leptospira biflexa]TGM40655.1 hypothetical protein EHQ89_01425 [Leptospira biflexa]TGM55949.1 hypothetical protein EHQ91_13755 [Leptospira biflexa]